MPRILIAGCGYVGAAAADFFHERGWEVEGWTRSAQSASALSTKPYSVRVVDIVDTTMVGSSKSEFEVVLQCASSGGGDAEEYRRVYLEGARNLLHAFPAAALLFTSSTSVYAQRNHEVVNESSLAEPVHEKGQILRETEKLVLAYQGIVARLGGIYGPGRSFLLRKFLAGEAVIDPENDHVINQAHRDDIASALFLLAERRAELRGEIYNVVDDQPIVAGEVYKWLGSRLHRPLRQGGTPPSSRKRGESNKRVSNQRLRALGWAPRYANFAAAMSESILPSFGFDL